MGGVGLLDRQIGAYRPTIRGKNGISLCSFINALKVVTVALNSAYSLFYREKKSRNALSQLQLRRHVFFRLLQSDQSAPLTAALVAIA
ncbi:hypothetical protein T12_13366 [Trichinella patagoniensis]|uniref:Uncharacterized protein n=1 Tax=Trichinella patagoniensis TaxID=990121 RepID=A0A0V0ZAM4_9BILA|nr:hypothetical protein T12_13366 [Trichinella patagoniensis]